MEQRGLITREPVPYDGRFKRIVPSEKALQNKENVLHGVQALESRLLDGISKEQLKFENVIVLETEIKPYPGDEVIKYVDWEGGENAKGYYISEGKMVPITWSKAGMYDPLKFFDANGNELQLNRGKSYIAFTYAGNCKVEG